MVYFSFHRFLSVVLLSISILPFISNAQTVLIEEGHTINERVKVKSPGLAVASRHDTLYNESEGRIIFNTFRPGNRDIYYFAAPGAQAQRLTDSPSLDYSPSLSPDGQWVVFTSERRGTPDLFALDLKSKKPPKLLIEGDVMEDQATFSPDGKTLVFVSTRDGNADLFSVPFRPDHTFSIEDATKLTTHPAADLRPAVSPDGQQVAFSSTRDKSAFRILEGGDIHLMDIDGSNPRRITRTPPGEWAGSPAWSPDSKTLYFYHRGLDRQESMRLRRAVFDYRLSRISAKGGDTHTILDIPQVTLSPALTKDGRVAFAVGHYWGVQAGPGEPWGLNMANFSIWSVLPDGSLRRMESTPGGNYKSPSFALNANGMVAEGPGPIQWDQPQTPPERTANLGGPGELLVPGTPLSKELADQNVQLYPIREFFATPHPSGNQILRRNYPGPGLVLSNLDGSNPQTVIGDNPASGPGGTIATFSPDGEWLIYMDGPLFAPPNVRSDLWKVRIDGTEAVNLTPDSDANDGFPSFSADGKWIVFRSGRDRWGGFEIYRMDVDGTNVQKLTSHPARDTFPAISPDGNMIVFSSNRDAPEEQERRVFELYLMELKEDGSPGPVKRITNTGVRNAHAWFSPDGKWIVFTSLMGGQNDEAPLVQSLLFAPQLEGEIYAYRIENGYVVRLTHNKWEDGFPSWVRAPTGKKE